MTPLRRTLFGVAGGLLMFPTNLWVDFAGLALLAVAAAPPSWHAAHGPQASGAAASMPRHDLLIA